MTGRPRHSQIKDNIELNVLINIKHKNNNVVFSYKNGRLDSENEEESGRRKDLYHGTVIVMCGPFDWVARNGKLLGKTIIMD